MRPDVSGRPGHRENRVLVALGATFVVFLALPVLGLLAGTTPSELARAASSTAAAAALRLSLGTSLVSTLVVVVFGTPLAWSLARSRGRSARWVEILVQLPIVLPPSVAGVALLLAFGHRGLFAGWLFPHGSSLAFTTAAVVVAQVFVSAPLYVQSAASAFRDIDDRILIVARTLGARPLRVFLRVAIPVSARALLAGAAMSWARALGEFGATLMFAGNMEGTTQTLPLAIYTTLEEDVGVARALSAVLVVIAFALLFAVRALAGGREERA